MALPLGGMETDTYYASSLICRRCDRKSKCCVGENRRIKRWKHEDVLEEVQEKLEQTPDAMTIRARTVEHPFGTIKLWTGSRHFLTKGLDNVRTEMSLNVLAYNLQRMISVLGVVELIKVVRALSLLKITQLIANVTRYKSRKNENRNCKCNTSARNSEPHIPIQSM